MNYFYVLKSSKDRNYYYGSTVNLERRLSQHYSGRVLSTKYRLPVNLVYYEAYLTLGGARKREKQVKSNGSARKALFQRINSGP